VLLSPPWRIGVDVGGTFTDVVVADRNGRLVVRKSPSLPSDPTQGILRALAAAAAEADLPLRQLLSECSALVHGSTVATNTVLEGKGARVGLLYTVGFRDALTIRRGIRTDPWRHRDPYPRPLVPRNLRLPVRGRIGPDGEEREALCIEDVARAVRQLRNEGVEAIAVAFLHSYANPMHERAARKELARSEPSLMVLLSCEVAPIIGEYARTSTTVAAAAIAPRVLPYLAGLERRLAAEGHRGSFLLMQSNGGLITPEEVAHNPSSLLLSGPSGGTGALRWLAAATGRNNLITLEMGGTSCDLMLMHEGRIEMTDELEVAGYHLRVPAVDIHTVSAGGGSIARVDAGGVMTLGPDGAGSDPGPAAYRRGGTAPTDTDAQLVLGRLRSGPFAGGAMMLDAECARQAIEANIADRLGIATIRAASGIVRLQGQALVHAVERISVERGFDPRAFSIVAVGGAAAVHAAAVARRLGCRRVLVPRLAGVFCAFGMLNADIRRDAIQSCIEPLTEETLDKAEQTFISLESEVASALARQHLQPQEASFQRGIDLRYPGQQSALRIPYFRDIEGIVSAFEIAHRALYGHLQPGSRPVVAALRVSGSIAAPAIPTLRPVTAGRHVPKPKDYRDVWMEDVGLASGVPVYCGPDLLVGCFIVGPCIVEERTTTILVNPCDALRVDASDTLIIEIHPKQPRHTGERQHEVAL
jgi:N-methylhydantoinase A